MVYVPQYQERDTLDGRYIAWTATLEEARAAIEEERRNAPEANRYYAIEGYDIDPDGLTDSAALRSLWIDWMNEDPKRGGEPFFFELTAITPP